MCTSFSSVAFAKLPAKIDMLNVLSTTLIKNHMKLQFCENKGFHISSGSPEKKNTAIANRKKNNLFWYL